MLLSAFLLRICAQEKNYVFQHLTTKDGLNSDFVQSVFQDSKGFYWVATTSGLQKFDGYTFSKPLRAGNDLLPISTITETKDGTIWISNQVSLFRFNRTTEKFTPLVPKGTKPTMNLKVIEDSTGNIWLTNSLELYKYDPLHSKLVPWLTFPSADFSKTKGSIAHNKNENVIWVQNEKKLYKIIPAAKTVTEEAIMPYQSANMWADGKYLWLGFWEQFLCRFNTSTLQKDWFRMPYKVGGSQITNYAVPICFARDLSGKLWIGTGGGGLWDFDEFSYKPVQVKTDNIRPWSFHYNEIVVTMQVDKAGNIWIGSDRGLNILNPSYQRFYTINNSDLPTKNISATISQKPFETRESDILVSTYRGGWLHYDHHFNLKRNFTIVLNSKSTFIDTCKTNVTCFAQDKNGEIWVGHRGGLIGIYNPVTGVIKYSLVPQFNRNKISDIQPDAMGNMWFALRDSSNNLVKWNKRTGEFKAYNDGLLKKSEPHESSILITRQGTIWVQTFGNGIYCFDPVKEKIAEIHKDDQPPFHIPSAVHGISLLNDSILAIASFAKGFFLFNTNQKTVAPLNTDQDLPSNIARAITTDRQGIWWIATLSDLLRMNPITKKITSFDEEEGVLNKSFTYGYTKLRDGRLFIVSNTGLLYFHPDSIKTQPPPPNVLLTGLKISNQDVLLDSILEAGNNKVRLSYDQNFLSIDYVSISYLNRKTTQYFYQLKGLENDWVKAGTNRSATYTNLGPGKYAFMVKAENRDGVFTKNITYLNIIIFPPWWRTWWAYTLSGIILFSMAYFIYRNRIRLLEKKQQAEIKAMVATQEDERKRISRDLHDDVGTKLSALKLFLSSLHEKAEDTNNEEIKSLAKSSEQFITEAMQDVRQLLLNLSPTVLEEFGYTTAVEGLVNKINETHLIKFTLVVFGMRHRLQRDYELALYRITQELINNVLKHAAAKNVSLQIGRRDEKIILMMEDDGIGFDVNTHKDGYGLQNLDVRTKLMHGIMTIDSQTGKGTSVLIEIPYNINGI